MFKPTYPTRKVILKEKVQEGSLVRILWVNYAKVAKDKDKNSKKLRVTKTGGLKGETIEIFDGLNMMFEVDVV